MNQKFYVIGSTVVAALGGFLFGFDTAVISGTTQALERVFQLSPFALGFTVAIALIGTVLGSILVGKPGDTLGRKPILIVLAVLYAVSALGSALAGNWLLFLFFRFIGGLAVGGASVMSPMYIAEIAPARLRGRLVAVQQFNIVVGILIAYFSNYLVAVTIQNQAWRWMFGVEFIPAFLFFILLFFIPHSPRWLAKQNRIREAKDVLLKSGEPDVAREMKEILESLKLETIGAREKLFQRKYRTPLLAAILLAVFNQLTGINVIIYYAPRIFESARLASDIALSQTVVLGFTNLIFTVLAMTMIDKFGRKTLLIIGSVGMTVFLSLVSRAFFLESFSGYTVLISLVGFLAFFAFSQGAVIWVFLSEIFPNRVRAKGQALGSFTHWVGAATISWLFPVITKSLGSGPTFLFFSFMMILQLIFVVKILPETKGKSLEQIQKELGIE